MKVTQKMIARQLRLPGRLLHLFTSVGPNMRITGPKPPKKFLISREERKLTGTYYQYIRRPDGTLLRLLVHRPKYTAKPLPGVLWLHGGGYAIGRSEVIYLSMARTIRGNCVLVAPDYRLSVEKPYPAAIKDSYLALLWMKKHANDLGIRSDQLFVGGESAGGGLTAALCMYARDKGKVNIAYQMPVYPMLDDRMQTESMKDNNAPVWDEAQNANAWRMYLKGVDRSKTSKYAAPAREVNYSNLPPATTFVGSIDPFCDETKQYVFDLRKAGVKAELKVFDGCYHAFDMLVPWSRQAKQAKKFFVENFIKASNEYSAPQK